jgi:hypothetical protein
MARGLRRRRKQRWKLNMVVTGVLIETLEVTKDLK